MVVAERESGIDVIGRVPWGTHFGLFYKTKHDLVDFLVPYFKEGLKNNEFCMWVTAEPLNAEEAKAHMAEALPDFNVYMDKGQIEIIPYTEWYKINGVFDPERVLNGWVEKLRKAQARGFSGLRLTGNESWLEPSVWKDFIDYEQTINDVIGQYDILAVCTYSLDKCDANDILDVVGTHLFALTRRNGEWKIIEDQGQKNARKALQESEERFRVIYDRAAMGIAISNRDGRIQDCNNAFRAMLGYSIDELRQKHFADITYPDDLGKNLDLFKRSVAGQIDKYQMEKRYVRKDGSLIWCLLTTSVITDTNGEFMYSLAIIDDITERKRAEEALRESEERYRPLFEHMMNGLAHCKMLFDDQNRPVDFVYLAVNDAFGRLTGLENVVGKRVTEAIPGVWELHPELFEIYGRVALTGQSEKFEIEFKPLSAWLSIAVYSTERGYFTAIFEDITNRKQAEEELKSAKAQAELYVDLMSHDINNMHQIALGYLELARDMPAGDGQATFLDKPAEVLQRSAQLIQNVRKLQKLRDGVFRTQDVDVCKVLFDVQREFGAVPNKSVTLNINGYESCLVRANELLHDVFANLVSNAIKHTGDRADIVVDLDVVKDNGSRYYRVMVEDNGPGIPDDFKTRIFNRMLKGTNNAKGMGLGLYLVKSLVDSYSGRIWAEDRVFDDHTKGANFVVMLPAVEK